MADWDLRSDPLADLRDGDPGPFEAFVRSHARVFFAYFRRQGAGQHRAEDLTQDVFLKLYHHAARYRSEDRFQALCFRIARNIWIDDRRKSSTRGANVSIDRDSDAESEARAREVEDVGPVERVSIHEESGRLRGALRELPEPHRAVFELGVIEELGYADIGAILDIPVGTVKSRMYHAVRKLRRALGEDFEEGAA